MIDMGKIRELTEDAGILEFSEFVVSEAGEGTFPDYRKMDLMKIARLVSSIWVLDFKNGLDDGLPFHFSGTQIDETFGRNITGQDFEKIYPGEFYDQLINQTYHQIYLQKRPCYTRRAERYLDDLIDKRPAIETILFPCSSDGENINFGLGMTNYTYAKIDLKPIFMLL